MQEIPESDWIEWSGGERPVPADAVVCVRTADNDSYWETNPAPADTFDGYPPADLCNWWKGGDCEEWRITAYRVLSARSGEAV